MNCEHKSTCHSDVNSGTILESPGVSGLAVGLKLASVNCPGDRKAESVNGFTGRWVYQLFSRLLKDYGLLTI